MYLLLISIIVFFFVNLTSANNIKYTTIQVLFNNAIFFHVKNVEFRAYKPRFKNYRQSPSNAYRSLHDEHALGKKQCYEWFNDVEDHRKNLKTPNCKLH